jgi:hypothetical protein
MAFSRCSVSQISLLLCTINVHYAAATAQSTAQATILVGTAFIPDSHPKSLQASAVTVIDGTLTYRLSCPTGTSPENIACQNENRYPALATYFPGSIFAGAFTTASASAATRWNCALGSGSGDIIPNQYGVCNRTVVEGGSTTVTSTAMNSCFIARNQVPITFTAGFEYLNVDKFGLQDGEALASGMDDNVRVACKGYTSSAAAPEITKGSVKRTPSSSNESAVASGALSLTGLIPRPTTSDAAPMNTAGKNGAFRLNSAPVIFLLMFGMAALSMT